MQDGAVSLVELRSGFSSEKEFLDHMFDEVTETNLLAGLPQAGSGEAKVALRNTGPVDVTVEVAARMANGQVMTAPATVRAKSFGEVVFKTPNKISKVEIDAEKLYPQTDYSDDVAPREFTDSDLLLAVKRYFDKQDFANAEKAARTVLAEVPRFDDVRVLLARSLLAQGKTAEAEKEFRSVLDEKLPSSRSIAWANVGLGEIAQRAGQSAQAAQFARAAIEADAEYGASLAARTLRNKANTSSAVDESVKAFFAQFDRAAASNRKAELEALVVPGEVGKFAAGIAGQTQQWNTRVLHADPLDSNTILVETAMSIRLLNRETETGMAVFRLARAGSGWKLAAVDIFEVR
jgi:tetratricopeptide (TPR) repeat protein